MTIDDIKKEILSKLNLESEFQSFGIKINGGPSPKGWVKCPSPFNADKFPSCGVNVDNQSSFAGYLRIFNNSGPRQAIGFFDLAAELNPACSGREFIDILKHYAEKTGVEFDYEAKKKAPAAPKGEIVAIYDYCDQEGKLIYQVCRLKPKSFRQRKPKNGAADSWIWNMDGATAVPYHIKNVIDNKTVYILEGEKCADDLIDKFKLPSTTFHGGAGKFWPAVMPYFKNKDIILLPDNDDTGKDHMKRLAREFQDIAESIKIVELPGLGPKGDISDWITAGGTKDQFMDLCKKAPAYEATDDPVDELNKNHAVILVGGKVRILYETTDVLGRLDIQFLTEFDFKTLYANHRVPNPLAGTAKGQPKQLPLATAWLGSHKRREYKGIIFEPQAKTDKFYNLFSGFAYQPDPGDWSLFKKHIFENICSENMRDFDWLMSWLARIVQRPGGKKPGTAVVLRGERGTGKGVFAETFGQIFGQHFYQVTNSKQVTGRFNAHLKDCILLYLDEAWFAGDKSSEGVLKGLITSDRHMIEFKGKDAFMVSNYVNCIITSNSSWVVPVGNKERRFFMLDVGENHIQDHEYFDAIYNQMYKNDGISAMLHDLLAHDISQHNLREAPKTQSLFEQLMQNFSSFEQFWFEKLISNLELGDYDNETKENNILSKSKLYDQYVEFCKKINTKYIFTPAVFGKNLSRYCDFESMQRTANDQSRYRCYVFPEKNDCKKQFSAQVGMEIDWESSRARKNINEIDKI